MRLELGCWSFDYIKRVGKEPHTGFCLAAVTFALVKNTPDGFSPELVPEMVPVDTDSPQRGERLS
jgi:hypothetical protein